MNAENFGLNEEEVLLAFAIEPTHDRATLERYLRQYPEHAHALVDCSVELMIDTARGIDEVQVSSVRVVEQAWQQFQSAFDSSETATAPNPFAQLSPTAFKSVAKRLNISNLLLIRFRERAIDASTIPARLVKMLASELGATADAVSTYLRSPPAMVSGQSFRSNVKPAMTAQISFEEAVETSQLTAIQMKTLQALQD